MRFISKGLVGATLVLSVLMLSAPVQASSLTTNQANAIIMLLQSFGADQSVIANVQADLGITVSSGTTTSTQPWQPGDGSQSGMPPGQIGKMICIALNRNLDLGSQGDDVKSLQQVLAQDPSSGFTSSATGFFGPLTQKAMMRFQMNNGIAPSSNASGSVGPLTRAFFKRRCGEGIGNSNTGEDTGSHTGQDGHPPLVGVGGGTITANNGSSITIQSMDGKTHTVNITASTTVEIFTGTSTPPMTGSLADLVVNKMVTIAGTNNQDGSITALHIRLGQLLLPLMMQGHKQEGNDR